MQDFDLTEVPDLKNMTRELLFQVPEGMVTSYKDIAEALGDPGAARAVGKIMADNDSPDVYPCWRVVHSDGRVGNYSGRRGQQGKIAKMAEDGIPVRGNRIENFSEFRFQNFDLDPPLPRLRRAQGKISEHVEIEQIPNPGVIAGVDVSYGDEGAVASYVETDEPSDQVVREETYAQSRVRFPYIPGYLAFRELPVLAKLLEKVKNRGGLADVIFVDGNGLLHPRKAGLASHLGVELDHPTVGVAKKLLCGEATRTNLAPGEMTEVRRDDELLGLTVQTYERANPIYVSIGNKVELKQAGNLALRYSKYKLPEPLRLAHKLAKKEAT